MFPIWSDPIAREAASRIFSLAKEKGISIFAAGDHALITADSKPIRTLLSKINVHDIPVRDPLPDERFAVISLVESDVHPSVTKSSSIRSRPVSFWQNRSWLSTRKKSSKFQCRIHAAFFSRKRPQVQS